MSFVQVDNFTLSKTNLAMFSSESTCNPHKNKFSDERYKQKTFNHTHALTHQLEQKITVLRSRDIDSNGVHIDTAPLDVIEGSNGKNNNSGLI